jgi:hypothetical protein
MLIAAAAAAAAGLLAAATIRNPAKRQAGGKDKDSLETLHCALDAPPLRSVADSPARQGSAD